MRNECISILMRGSTITIQIQSFVDRSLRDSHELNTRTRYVQSMQVHRTRFLHYNEHDTNTQRNDAISMFLMLGK